jgi:hypothetical protein
MPPPTSVPAVPPAAGVPVKRLEDIVSRMKDLAKNRGDASRRSRRERASQRGMFRELCNIVEVRLRCAVLSARGGREGGSEGFGVLEDGGSHDTPLAHHLPATLPLRSGGQRVRARGSSCAADTKRRGIYTPVDLAPGQILCVRACRRAACRARRSSCATATLWWWTRSPPPCGSTPCAASWRRASRRTCRCAGHAGQLHRAVLCCAVLGSAVLRSVPLGGRLGVGAC